MVFVEENDEKVFGCISLESIICKSIELLLGDNAGQGFSFLLPPEEEARITDAIRVWEEQGEGDDETLNPVKVEPTELDTLPDSTALGAEDTQDAHNLLVCVHCPSCLFTVSPSAHHHPPPTSGSQSRSKQNSSRSTRSSASGRVRKEGANTYSTGLRAGSARATSSTGQKDM
jgi:hypothetical protein